MLKPRGSLCTLGGGSPRPTHPTGALHQSLVAHVLGAVVKAAVLEYAWPWGVVWGCRGPWSWGATRDEKDRVDMQHVNHPQPLLCLKPFWWSLSLIWANSDAGHPYTTLLSQGGGSTVVRGLIARDGEGRRGTSVCVMPPAPPPAPALFIP